MQTRDPRTIPIAFAAALMLVFFSGVADAQHHEADQAHGSSPDAPATAEAHGEDHGSVFHLQNLGTLVIAKDERTYEGSIPLVTFGAMTAAIIAVFTIASGAIILIPTWLWSLGLISYIDPLMYKLVWWGMGHSSQQVNVAVHVAVWYAIIAIVLGAKPLSEKVSRGAFLMYILFLQLASAHHLLVEPGLSSE